MGTFLTGQGKDPLNRRDFLSTEFSPVESVGLRGCNLAYKRARTVFCLGGNGMASGMDMKSANQTYDSFIGFVKFGTIACLAIGALVVLLISS